MPVTLPTFEVSDATAQRILKAFEGQVSDKGVAMTPTQAYRAWLRESLLYRVATQEAATSRSSLSSELV